MPWAQVYDPLGSAAASTCLAALPVVVLLGALGFFRARAHVAALASLGVALLVALGPFGMPVSAGLAATGFGAAYGLFPIGWIVLNLIFLYDLTRVARPLRGAARTSLAQLVARSARPGDRDRVLPGRLLRGRGRLRHARGRDRGTPDPARLHAARGLQPLAHREHGAGGVRRARDADHRAAGRDGARPPRPFGHGRPAASVLRAPRSVLGRGGACRAARDVGRLAGGARRRHWPSRAAVPHLELPRSLARRRRLGHRVDGRARAPAPLSGSRATGGRSTAARELDPLAPGRSARPTRRQVWQAWRAVAAAERPASSSGACRA